MSPVKLLTALLSLQVDGEAGLCVNVYPKNIDRVLNDEGALVQTSADLQAASCRSATMVGGWSPLFLTLTLPAPLYFTYTLYPPL